jgi:hypothetical protein
VSERARGDIVTRLRHRAKWDVDGATAALVREAAAEIEELRGVVKEYGDDPDYARSRFREIDLLKDQRAHDRLKIDSLTKEVARLRAAAGGEPVGYVVVEHHEDPSGHVHARFCYGDDGTEAQYIMDRERAEKRADELATEALDYAGMGALRYSVHAVAPATPEGEG